ncbi:hypothetical protein C5167_019231 [Papaver somniferum]|uniref:Uncharacterized protein n=1 Tax=Papaver somniferum TaxID=3469 RepID=A0A4Y7ISX5_PAPSO|nr:hypothetical protein C5167_019231 [Papaver somniferum]
MLILCIERMTSAESSRMTLVSHLKEALQGQEFELEQVRILLQEFGEGAYLEVYKELKAWQLEGYKCGGVMLRCLGG